MAHVVLDGADVDDGLTQRAAGQAGHSAPSVVGRRRSPRAEQGILVDTGDVALGLGANPLVR